MERYGVVFMPRERNRQENNTIPFRFFTLVLEWAKLSKRGVT